MKKWIGLFVALALVSMLAVGCGSSKDSSSKEAPALKLGLLPSIDAIPFIIANQQGFDKKHGVTLDIQTFKSAKDRDAAFQGGQLDGISGDLVAVAIYNQAGVKMKITSTTFGEFQLLTGNDEIQDVKDLKGKKVILSTNTSTEYTVAMMLKEAGLTEKDIAVTEVPQIPTRLELLKNKQADAAILPEPFVTMGQADGLRVLSSTTKLGINPFILGFPEDTIKAKEKEIKAMYAAYDEAVAYMKSHDKSEFMGTIIKEVGYPDSLKDQITVPDYLPANQVKASDIESAFAWAKEKGLLKKDLSPEDVISDVVFK
ncbi:ABC transporter substrate-binding protein [Gorillibacterium massiliense]|uniref:ABC transporter substrate-binding protein n=1 Tax=Gorillibacterium massiliense TaxID=1280390 RepID=UPI0004B45577|nr:MetQ/NlpA family ABC transporter substrate-binding protein [Gorillibacterium massiliense]